MSNLFKNSYTVKRGDETLQTSTLQDGDVVSAITRAPAADSPVDFEPITVDLVAGRKHKATESVAYALGVSTKLSNGLIGTADAERPAKYAELVAAYHDGVLFPVTKREVGRRVGDVAEAVFNMLLAQADGDTDSLPESYDSVDSAKETLKAMEADAWAKISQDPGVKAEVARIQLAKAEKAQAESGEGEGFDVGSLVS